MLTSLAIESGGESAVTKKRNQVSVLLDQSEYDRFSAYCAEHGFKKSTLIARLIRDHLNREGFDPQRQLPLNTRDAGGP